ncbi:DUF2786 domain-containing protein [Vibrio cholerae]|uniref:DUF2786 domain-containing protein n=1 Tax=Vibrio cholerae TaxID=666 RepID=UPI0000F34DAA|nr:DUF2786 domain-containing protein [Vibrio cholerae]APF79515.1 hypothetical protein ASZ85_01989 [Vibrio cholerae]APF83473.1 hypothetical protein ASZ86_02053 [Vibrio cholerae]EAZ73621.1 conserved hypothetical protein [Vibrio cholerae NCTC 8457]
MANSKHISKIKKLLRLAKSTNEHEAAAAMSRAQALMQQHGLSDESPELSDVCTGEIQSKFKAKKPTNYFACLSTMVAEAFGCRVYFNWNCFKGGYVVTFTGHNERPDVAAYAYEVLERQLIKARKEFISTLNKRIKASTKTSRADLFCEGWVGSVRTKVKEFSLSDEESQQLATYMKQAHPDLKTGNTRKASTKNARGGADDALWAGHVAGKAAELNHGVNGQEQGKLSVL